MKTRNSIFFIVIVAFLSAALFPGCINLKSEYPDINYYKLTQTQLMQINSKPVDALLHVRDFTISSDFKTDRLIARDRETPLKFYYYHRWLSDCDELITDFVIHRLSRYNIFSGGVETGTTVASPHYYLEGRIFEVLAHNNDENHENLNYVTVEIKFELIKNEISKSEKQIIFSKIYKKKVVRQNNKAKSIPASLSKAIADATDELVSDILTVLSN